MARQQEEALRARLGRPARKLDLDLITQGEDFFGATPRVLGWDLASRTVWFSWKRWNERERGTFSFELAAKSPERLPEGVTPPLDGVRDVRAGLRVYGRGEALYLETTDEQGGSSILPLQHLAGGFQDLVLGPDADKVFFRSGEGIFRRDLGGGLAQLLVMTKSPAPKSDEGSSSKKKAGDLAAWHKAEAKRLFLVLREREERRARQEKLDKERREARFKLPRYHIPKGFSVRGVRIAPDGAHMVVGLAKPSKARRTGIPEYVTPDGYTKMVPSRPKVGDLRRAWKLQVVDLKDGRARTIQPPVPNRGAEPWRAFWSPGGHHLLAVAKSDDDTEAWLLRVDPQTGAVKVLHHLKDPAWVRTRLTPTFLGDGQKAFFLSEATGYQQLYLLDLKSDQVRPLTAGRFEVMRPQAEPSGRIIYALATPVSPHVRDLVAISTATGRMTILTADGGGRRFTLAPDGKRLAEVYSRGNHPWELRIRELAGKQKLVAVTDSPSPTFKSLTWPDPPVIWFKASDGVKVPARIYRPVKPAPGHPAVLFVHGAGYLQNVHHWWSSYEREYGFHVLLQEAGYLVLDVDYRGSAGYGRDWRTAIYGHMGGRDLLDYVDAARFLVEREGVNPRRIGIYGGSYGGFLTLMALFTKPGVFAAGAALRPVTDWAHYNDGYTSNILDDPLESPRHYALSSPINFAEGLQDHLLICHGIQDFNVHAQDVFRLEQRLIELHKRHWQVASYPLEGHGFREASSWDDEYHRIKALFDRVLLP